MLSGNFFWSVGKTFQFVGKVLPLPPPPKKKHGTHRATANDYTTIQAVLLCEVNRLDTVPKLGLPTSFPVCNFANENKNNKYLYM
jgi:hypothetical protein